jgi:hypothetical protein
MIPVNPAERTLQGEVEADSTLSVNTDIAVDFGRLERGIVYPVCGNGRQGPANGTHGCGA